MKWQPLDIAVLILVITVCVTLMLSVISVVFFERTITDAQSKRTSGLVTSIIAILSMYLGAKIQQHRKE